jgi:hypothetical protein
MSGIPTVGTNVIYAGYGCYNKTWTVTGEAQGQMADSLGAGQPSVTFFAANDAWGGDPAPGLRKYFFIAWQQNPPFGPINSGVVGENDGTGVVVPTGA